MKIVKISKFLSFVLRHKPEAIELELDAQGWASLDEIASKAGIPLNRAQIIEAVATSEKQRFALSDDGNYIRANQGTRLRLNWALRLLSHLKPYFTVRHGGIWILFLSKAWFGNLANMFTCLLTPKLR